MIEEINTKLVNYLKKESGCINVESSNYNGLITFKFDLLNPEHTTKEIWENVKNILTDYILESSGCERIKDNVVRVMYKIRV